MMYCSQMRGPGRPQDDAGRSQVCDADAGGAVFPRMPRMRALQSGGGRKGRGSSFSVVADLPCQHRRVQSWGQQRQSEMSSLDMAQHFARKKGKRCDARVLLDALPVLPATQSKVSPKGPSSYDVHPKRGREQPKSQNCRLGSTAQKLFALEMGV